MKKIFKLLFVIFCFTLFIFKINASEKILLEETNKSFGEILTNYEVSDSIYLKNGNKLEKINIETKERTTIHEFETEEKDTFMFLNNNILYFYYNDNENTKVIRYDILSDSEESITLNTSEVLGENKKLYDLRVDSRENMYFNYSTNSFISFDKAGKYIDSYEPNINAYIMNSSVSYYDEKLFVYFPMSHENGYIEINDGKFINKKIIYSDVDSGMIYTSDGLYAVNNHNQIYKLNDEKDTLKYIIETPYSDSLSATIRFNNDYIYIEGRNAYYRFNKNDNRIDKIYKIDFNFNELKYYNFTIYNDEVYVIVYDKDYNYYLMKLDDQETRKIIMDTHKTQEHSVADIKNKYLNSLPKFNYKNNIYDKTPSYKNGKYVAGKLKKAVANDTLNQLNFYRWLYGINNVSINEEYMERSQAGAVIQKKLGKMTHVPSKPKDMSTSFYKLAYAGVNAGIDYSGNVSWGNKVYDLSRNYILDVSNVQTNVGHRLSMLDITSNKTSFGYLNPYSAMSMYTTEEDLGNHENWYAWPTAGYFPVNDMDPNMFWSVILNGDYFYTGLINIKLIDSANKEYKVTGYGVKSKELFFQLPKAFISKIVNNKKFIIGEECTVKITGIYDNDYNEYEINYKVHFINAKTGQSEKIKVDTPKISVSKNSNYTVKIKINNYNEKQKYIVEKSTNNKKWTKAGTFTSDEINISGLKFGQKTYFRVKTTIYDYKKYSAVSNITVKPNKVNLKITSASTNNVKLSWEKVSTTGYEVYMGTKTSNMKKIKTITKNSTLSFNKTKLKANTTYYFKVRAYKTVSKKKVYGQWSTTLNTKTAPSKPKISLSIKSLNEMNIKISSVKGATKYIVEKSLDGLTYEPFEELSELKTIIDSNLEIGTKYYYRVRTCNSQNRCSGWVNSNKKFTTKVPGFKLSTSSKKVIIELNPVEGANGYEIHRATKKKGKYTLVKELTSEEELKYNNSTKKGTTYYYKVRSYMIVNEEKIYSDYSTIKSIKSK